MATARSASRTCGQSASASEYTATARMPRVRQARMMRRAISPRLAIRTLDSKGSGGRGRLHGDDVEHRRAPAALGEHPARRERDGAVGPFQTQLDQAMTTELGEGHHPVAGCAARLER